MQKDPEARLSINDMVVSDKALNNGLTDLCGGLQASLLLVFWWPVFQSGSLSGME